MTILTVFVTSGVLILLFLLGKRFEFVRGFRVAEGVRLSLDRVSSHLLNFLGGVLPHRIVHTITHFFTSIVHFCTVLLLQSVRGVERRLVWATNFVNGRRELQKKQAPSSFLENVTSNKEALNGDRQNGYYEK